MSRQSNCEYSASVSRGNHIAGGVTFFVAVVLILASLLTVVLMRAEPDFAEPKNAITEDGLPADAEAEQIIGSGEYAKSLLPPEDFAVYDEISAAVSTMSNIEGLEYAGEIDALNAVVSAVYQDHPEYFWFIREYSSSYMTSAENPEEKVVSIWFQYTISEEEREQAQARLDEISAELEAQWDGLSDFELSKAIYDYLIENIVYDLDYNMQTMYSALVDGRAVCTGYARFAQYLFHMMGLDCLAVESEEHTWNVVNLDGDYYQFDATWGDQEGQNDYTDYLYLNFDDELASKLEHHLTVEPMTIPECVATADSYYHHEQLYFEALDKERIEERIVQSRGEQIVSFRFANEHLMEEAMDWLIHNYGMNIILNDQGLDKQYIYYADEIGCVLTFYFE